MTPEQQAALKAYILANQDLADLYNAGNLNDLASALNENASPTFYVWKSSVSQDEIMRNGFDWVRVDNLSVGKARIWEWMFDNEANTIDPSKVNVRAGIAEVWKGTAADNAVRLAVLQHCQRPASRYERVFATGTGTTVDASNVGPGDVVLEGPIAWPELIGL